VNATSRFSSSGSSSGSVASSRPLPPPTKLLELISTSNSQIFDLKIHPSIFDRRLPLADQRPGSLRAVGRLVGAGQAKLGEAKDSPPTVPAARPGMVSTALNVAVSSVVVTALFGAVSTMKLPDQLRSSGPSVAPIVHHPLGRRPWASAAHEDRSMDASDVSDSTWLAVSDTAIAALTEPEVAATPATPPTLPLPEISPVSATESMSRVTWLVSAKKNPSASTPISSTKSHVGRHVQHRVDVEAVAQTVEQSAGRVVEFRRQLIEAGERVSKANPHEFVSVTRGRSRNADDAQHLQPLVRQVLPQRLERFLHVDRRQQRVPGKRLEIEQIGQLGRGAPADGIPAAPSRLKSNSGKLTERDPVGDRCAEKLQTVDQELAYPGRAAVRRSEHDQRQSRRLVIGCQELAAA
jgi:hypothetical protein